MWIGNSPVRWQHLPPTRHIYSFIMNETKLYLDLLRAINCPDEKRIENLLKAVSNHLPSIMSAVWLLNDRSNTVSILTRVNYSPKFLNEIEFVHKLEGSLIGYMVTKMHMGDLPYLDIPSIKTV